MSDKICEITTKPCACIRDSIDWCSWFHHLVEIGGSEIKELHNEWLNKDAN